MIAIFGAIGTLVFNASHKRPLYWMLF